MKSLRKRTGKSREETDKFLSLTERVKLYFMENTTKAYAALGVIAAVVALTVLVSLLMSQSYKNQLALQAEALAYYDVESPVPGDQPMEPVERIKKAKELFSKIAEEHSGGPLAGIARFYEANSEVELGEMDKAVEGYRDLAARSMNEPVLYSVASLRLASALEAGGDVKGALEVYKAMQERGVLRDEAYFRAAQLYEDMGDSERAVFEYMAVKKDFPSSPRLPETLMRLEKLQPPEMEAPSEAAPARPEAPKNAPAGTPEAPTEAR